MADFDESRSMVFKNDGNDEYFDELRKIQTNLTLTVAKMTVWHLTVKGIPTLKHV